MKHLFGLFLIVPAAVLLALGGCGDDDGGSSREPRTVIIPAEMTFEEAADQAVAGDTLIVASFYLPLDGTVAFRSSQTPLVIRGEKNYPIITITSNEPALRFEKPRAGTRVEGFLFGAPGVSIEAVGPGEMTVHDCRFNGGTTQIHGINSGLLLTVTGNLMRQPALFAVDVPGGSELVARQNTIDQAGNSGIMLQSGATGTVQNCIILRSAEYGIVCLGSATLDGDSGCNDVYQSGTAHYQGCEAPESDFSLDPLFCDLDGGDYTVYFFSPCVEPGSDGCGRIGAFGVGCETDPTGAASPRRGSR